MHAYVQREGREGDNGEKKKRERLAEHCALALRRERPDRGGGSDHSTRVSEQSSTAIRRSSREANTKTRVGIDTERKSLCGIQHS